MSQVDRPPLGSFLERAQGRLAGADPGLVRLRMAGRVTLTIVFVALALAALHAVLTLSRHQFLGRDDARHPERHRDQGPHPPAGADPPVLRAGRFSHAGPRLAGGRSSLARRRAVFLVTFLVRLCPQMGLRWNAVGMFGFMACFIGAYFHPALSDLPSIALTLGLSGLVAHVVREYLLPDRPAFDFAQTLRAVEERIGAMVSRTRAGKRAGWPPAARREAIAAEQAVKSAIAVAEGLLPDDAEGAARNTLASKMAIKLFDLHLATETTLAAALDEREGDADSTQRLSRPSTASQKRGSTYPHGRGAWRRPARRAGPRPAPRPPARRSPGTGSRLPAGAGRSRSPARWP